MHTLQEKPFAFDLVVVAVGGIFLDQCSVALLNWILFVLMLFVNFHYRCTIYSRLKSKTRIKGIHFQSVDFN